MSDLHKHHEDHPDMVSRNARRGLGLFLIYFVFYVSFLLLSVYRPDIMKGALGGGDVPIGGINVAVIMGFSLILLAFVLALIYMRLTRTPRS